MSKWTPEKIADLDSVQQVHRRLENFALTTDLTRELESRGLEIIRSVLAHYGASINGQSLTPTYFFLPSQVGAVTRVLGTQSLKDATGEFSPRNDLICLQLDCPDLSLILSFFHEQFHSLGKCLLVETDDKKTFRVGFFHQVSFGDGWFTERGGFIEEAVVDWLANAATILFVKETAGNILTSKQIIDQTDEKIFFITRAALLIIFARSPELLPLLVQARFDPKTMGRLNHELNRQFGFGGAKKLFSIPLQENEIADTVDQLLEKNR